MIMWLSLFISIMDGEEKSFLDGLYHNYKGLVYAIGAKYLDNQHDINDVVQIVFINVIENKSDFENRSDDDITALLVTYAKNAAIDLYRKKKVKDKHEIQMGLRGEENGNISKDIPDLSINTEDLVINRETLLLLQKAAKNLTDNEREIIMLRVIEGQSAKTVAKMLGISQNAVNSRLKRARKRLCELFKKEMP